MSERYRGNCRFRVTPVAQSSGIQRNWVTLGGTPKIAEVDHSE